MPYQGTGRETGRVRPVLPCRGWPAVALAVSLFLISAQPTFAAADMVAFDGGSAKAGTIVVVTKARRLYLVTGPGQALRYKVGVGRSGRQWSGKSTIDGMYLQPNWEPPEEVRRDNPALPQVIASGSPRNPMGAAALTLSGGSYAIHGTNSPKSIGGFVSYGCIRMYNADIMDLFARVAVGTTVVVTQ